MKRITGIIIICVAILNGCTKPEPVRTSGIDTIDNTIFKPNDPYVYGFSFKGANLISSKSNPGPDLLLFVNIDNLPHRLTIQVKNLKKSFYKVGDFADEAAAITAFDHLKTVDVTQWLDMADPVAANQVWIYRSGADTYAKFRIISTINETRLTIPYGECTFQWVYQPDGSLTFPGK
jgi:hypothetical protein